MIALLPRQLRVAFVGRSDDPALRLLSAIGERLSIHVVDPAAAPPREAPLPKVDAIVAAGPASELRAMIDDDAAVLVLGADPSADVAIPREPLSAPILELAIEAAIDRRAARRVESRAKDAIPDFEIIFEAAPLGIALVSTEGVILDVNPALARLLGFGRVDLHGVAMASLLDPFANETTTRSLFTKLRGGDFALKRERRLRRKDGGFVRTEISTSIVRDPRGAPLALLQTVVDLTERAEAERALREAHEFLSAALQHSPAGVLIVERPSGRIVLSNERLHEIDGVRVEASMLSDYVKAVKLVREDGSPYPEAELPLIRTLADGASHEAGDVWVERSDGIRLPIVCRSAPIPYNGRDAAILVVEDVTHFREEERQRRSAEALYRSLFDQVNDGTFVVTAELQIVEANPAGEALFGYGPGELVSSSIPALAPAEQGDGRSSTTVLAEHAAIARRSGHATFSWRGMRRGGGFLDLELRVQPIRLDRAPDLLLVQARDVTRQRILEEELRQSQKLEAIGLLAGGLAHDYNNLLTGVVGFIELALDRLGGAGEDKRIVRVRKFLEEARRAANRSVELTQQLLTFSRRDKGKVELMDLNQSVERQASMIRRLLGETVALDLALAPEGCPIRGDAVLLEQALLNLAINARDAMPKGGGLRVETSRYTADAAGGHLLDLAPGDYVVLTVSDQGAGMSESVRARIFQPFFTTKERGRGTGLGLAVVHGVVQHHGGRIFVDSTLGEGTRFTIVLPCAGDGEVVARPGSGSRKPYARGTGRILVVDDDPIVREVTGAMLETLGYTVSMAESAAQALEHVASGQPFDLVVTDVVMPCMSGVELEQRLRAERPGLKVLLVSGYASEVFARHGIDEAAAPALLRKPLTIESLGAKVRELLVAKLS